MVCKALFQVDGTFVKCVAMNGSDDYYGHDYYFPDGKIAGEIRAEAESIYAYLKENYESKNYTDSRPFQDPSYDDMHQNDFQEYLEALEVLIDTIKHHPTARITMV